LAWSICGYFRDVAGGDSIGLAHRVVTEEQHLWACALEIQRQHGDRAPVFVAERIGALALAGDMAGVDRWKAIAACMDALSWPRGTHPH